MSSLGALTYKVEADVKDFTSGMKLTKKELNATRKVMRETATPAEKLGKELKELDNLYKKGAIDAKTYGRAVANLKTKFNGTKVAASKTNVSLSSVGNKFSMLGKVGGPIAIATLAVGGFYAAMRSGRALIGRMISDIGELDDAFNVQAQLGLSNKDFGGLSLLAEKASIEQKTLMKGVQKMVTGIDEAFSKGSGSGFDALERLGLDAKTLNKQNPVDQFKSIATAMKKVKNENEQLGISADLFGDRGAALINLLRQTDDQLESTLGAAEELGFQFNDLDKKNVSGAAAAFVELKAAAKGLFYQLAVAGAPALRDLAESLTAAAKEAIAFVTNNKEKLGKMIQDWSKWIVDLVDDVKGLLKEFNNLTTNIEAFSKSKFGEGLKNFTNLVLPGAGDIAQAGVNVSVPGKADNLAERRTKAAEQTEKHNRKMQQSLAAGLNPLTVLWSL